MKNNYITIVGNLPISFDLHESMHIGRVIASANTNKSINFAYATCNSETNLQDMLNSTNFQGTNILVPEELFKKYVFFNETTCLPDFPGIKTLEIDPNNCTPQCLSLMLAVYLKSKVIFLLGYDLNNPIEFTRLKSDNPLDGRIPISQRFDEATGEIVTINKTARELFEQEGKNNTMLERLKDCV